MLGRSLDFIDHWNHDWRMSSGIEEDASDVFFDFFLQDLHLWFGRDRLVSFYAQISCRVPLFTSIILRN